MYYIPKHANVPTKKRTANYHSIFNEGLFDYVFAKLCSNKNINPPVWSLAQWSHTNTTPSLLSVHSQASNSHHCIKWLCGPYSDGFVEKKTHERRKSHISKIVTTWCAREGRYRANRAQHKKKTLSLTLNCPLGKCIESLRTHKDHWPSGWTLFWPCLAGQG